MPVIFVSDAVIVGLSTESEVTLITISYWEAGRQEPQEKTVVLLADSRTLILSRRGIPIPASLLRVGMIIDATFASAMTRSIPPQAMAYLIRIKERQREEQTTRGTILRIDHRNNSFILAKERAFSDILQINLQEDTQIIDCRGRRILFSDLREGMQVSVQHANFMTASIPPQTTAFSIEVLPCR